MNPNILIGCLMVFGKGDTAGSGGIQQAMTLRHICDWNGPPDVHGHPAGELKQVLERLTETSDI